MDKKLAGIVFFVVCIILAILILTKAITAATSGIVFAAALAGLGLASRGFRNDVKKSE